MNKMDETTNALNWFEIAVSDITRAKAFYETILDVKMSDMEMEDAKLASFPYAPGSGKATGALIQSKGNTPSQEGAVIYLNANPNLSVVLDKIEAAGGSVAMGKTSIGPNGHIAFFVDTEGNRVGLHSME